MEWRNKLDGIQKSLFESKIDGWLLYDFRKNNDLACQLLEISPSQLLTRRFFYWIPQTGNPVKVVHAVEKHVLDHLPGEVRPYSSWQELQGVVRDLLKNFKQVAMEYSPKNAIPTMSKVDAGTVEAIRELGVEVVSSADLIQKHLCIWTEEQLKTHLEAADFLSGLVNQVWELISHTLKNNDPISERDVQKFMLEKFKEGGFVSTDPPICAVNAHSADPHYTPGETKHAHIRRDDFILIDLWCKKSTPNAVYADITRVAVASPHPTERQNHLFYLVREARDTAAALVQSRFEKKQELMGWEVDQACRQKIIDAGYGPYFIHRTGHNIGESDHGMGANIDNYETQDRRILLPGTCFSIEPGIYLPGEFGVRLEYDIYLPIQGSRILITGGIQQQIECLLKDGKGEKKREQE